jgi:DNA-binding transcriptional MerR regulator
VAAPADLTIDQLAQRTGMTVRNLRAHQSRGLLPPPEVRARTGYYGPEHVARVELIKELQADGLPLELIRRMVDQAAGSTADLLRFTRALREPFTDEEPVVADLEQLAELFGPDPALLKKAVRLGLLQPLGGGRYEMPSPRLAAVGAEIAALGIPPEQALSTVAQLRKQADATARTFIDLYLERVWKPFDRAGRPEEGWADVLAALERLRPLAADALLAVFQIAMGDAVEKAFGREIAKGPAGERRRRGSRS